MILPLKKLDPKCSCVTGHYECWNCRKPKLEAIERRLTPAKREYDRLALAGWRNDDDYDGETSCSCHISAPCGHCLGHCIECRHGNEACACDQLPALKGGDA